MREGFGERADVSCGARRAVDEISRGRLIVLTGDHLDCRQRDTTPTARLGAAAIREWPSCDKVLNRLEALTASAVVTGVDRGFLRRILAIPRRF